MSACSYDPKASPYSMTGNSDSGEDDDDGNESDLSTDERAVQGEGWSRSGVSENRLFYVDDPFVVASARNLPVPPNGTPASRPLPVIPIQRANSPSQRILATEQEDFRKPYPGLGLHLPNATTTDLTGLKDEQHAPIYTADEAKIRRDSQRTLKNSDSSDSDSADEAAVSKATLHNVSDKSTDQSDSTSPTRSSPVLKDYSPTRSPELGISREYVKQKMAQRRLAKESAAKTDANLEALKPIELLAPPLPHFDSFVRMSSAIVKNVQIPDSPISDSEYPTELIRQRKVSDSIRPTTPVEQINLTIPEPQSARAIHHEREKRLSAEFTQPDQPVLSPKPLFAPVNYDGDDYDDEPVPEDDLVLHTPVVELLANAGQVKSPMLMEKDEAPSELTELGHEDEEVLRTLPQIPDLPIRSNVVHSVAEPIPSTPKADSSNLRHMSLSLDFDGFGNESLGLEEFMTPEARPETPITSRVVALASPTKMNPNSEGRLDTWLQASEPPIIDAIPEAATITARGLKLRTRPSMTPADATQLAERRRKVSAEAAGDADIMLDSHAVLGRVRSESVTDSTSCSAELQSHEAQEGQIESSDINEENALATDQAPRPILQPLQKDLSFSDINSAFDRVMQKQKKGYIVRQQSRIVYASAHHSDIDPETNDSKTEEQSKGHTRQSSSVYTDISTLSSATKNSDENYSSHRRQVSRVPVGVQMSPRPQPAQQANQQPDLYENADGGRLFVKVMHVRHLTLPIPKGEESFFCCTLDNGKHCVTTPMHPLANNVKINQEFELIADHELEFILTLQAQYVPPVMPARPKSTLGRLLNSPKKHRPTGSITSLSLSGYVGNDGSFARAHLALKHFRRKAFGRPHNLSVPVLNEWALETTGMIKGVPVTRVRKPYKIGEIELQVLYVPPVEVEHRQALPTSLSQAVRDIRDAEWHSKLHCDGFLSQQGGDCPYWRRRHFKLVGPKLTAYHANTGQIRATINLAKALKITDDKDSLTAPDVTIGRGDNKKRRKSGFAEREEGHLYVAEGFRIRFANGEFIDFYADSAAEKQKWLKALDSVVQKVPVVKDWAKIVLESEAGSGQPVVHVK